MPMTSFHFFFLLTILALIMMMCQRHHILMALLFLEMMILSLTIFISLTMNPTNLYFLLIILTLGACEASMGLALLVSMTRILGAGLINLLTINKC